jgi:hypothetical protein
LYRDNKSRKVQIRGFPYTSEEPKSLVARNPLF